MMQGGGFYVWGLEFYIRRTAKPPSMQMLTVCMCAYVRACVIAHAIAVPVSVYCRCMLVTPFFVWTSASSFFPFSGQVVIFFFPERNLLFTIGNLDTNRYVLCRSSSPPRTRSASSMMHASRLQGVFCVCDTVRRCGSIIIIFVIMLQIRSFASSRF